jgi:SAM-dependent methyltransferase
MIKINIKEIFKNFIITFPVIKYLSLKNHKTGIQNNETLSKERAIKLTDLIKKYIPQPSNFLEVGPGQTSATASNLIRHFSLKKAYVVDTNRYFDDNHWSSLGIDFLYKDTASLNSKSIDFIYCFDVLEHISNPEAFFIEMKRILSNTGYLFASWDMRDHLKLNNEEEWFDMHKYSNLVWNLQMSNRSSFVNRLQHSEWINLFEKYGFEVINSEVMYSDIASDAFLEKYSIRLESAYRAEVVLKIKS